MKRFLIILGIAAVLGFAAFVTVQDAIDHRGAFARSADVYPVTAERMATTQKSGGFRGITAESGKILDHDETAAKIVQFESEASNEQEAEKKVSADMEGDGDQISLETLAMGAEETRAEVETEEYDPATAENKWLPYRVGRHNLDREIGDFLLAELRARDIEWWMPYALAQMFQESRLDPMAQNKNGLDKGILQYRVTYWDWSRGDIFDWRAQIRLYVEQTARRLASGCSIWETISRHNTSDYGSYNQEYVDQVMQWVEPEC